MASSETSLSRYIQFFFGTINLVSAGQGLKHYDQIYSTTLNTFDSMVKFEIFELRFA